MKDGTGMGWSRLGGGRAGRRWPWGARALLGAGFLAAAAACSPELGDQPFTCADGETCPEGYRCEAGTCMADGARPTVTRALRVTYINRSEMYWFPSAKGGATLIVNDGFSPGARGIYEIHVAPDGEVSTPLKLLSFNEQTVSSAVVALDEGRYGVITMSFPEALEDDLVLALHALPRDGDRVPEDVVLHRAGYPYFGGYEPAYVGAVVRGDDIVYAFTDPGEGGAVVVVKLTREGEVQSSFRIPLPEGVLPLSGDCMLWRAADNRLTLRVGLDVIRVFSLDVDEGVATEVPAAEGYPLFGFGGSVAYLNPNEDSSQVRYVLRDLEGEVISESQPEPFTEGLEPYTGVAYGAGALVAPLSTDTSFSSIAVGFMGPDGSFTRVANVDRQDEDDLYTARAYGSEGKAYVAWTTFHEQLMDLWVGVGPLSGVP